MGMGITFLQAVVVALGTAFVTGLFLAVKLLANIAHGMKYMVPSVRTLYQIQPYLTEAIRYQNSAFKELGANGSTIKSNECLDEVDKILNKKLAENSVGNIVKD